MVEIVVKKGKERIDMKRTPVYEKARRIAEERYAKMTDAEKKEAHANMAVNDMNLPGMPAFYPPQNLYSHGIGDGEHTEFLECGHRWRTQKIDTKGNRTYRCKHGHEFNRTINEVF